jgi:hypothetical protein
MKATSPRKQLNIRSDEAYFLAHALAERSNVSTQDVVLNALKSYAEKWPGNPGEETAVRSAEFQRLMEISRRARKKWKYGEGSDHADMYDEHGLPL